MFLLRLLKSKLLIGFILGILLACFAVWGNEYTSTNEFCSSCKIHPQAHKTWKRSTHFDNPSGTAVRCVDCHLPPGGFGYYWEKMCRGIKDVYGKVFKNPSDFDWERRSTLEHAVTHTFKASCTRCHQNVFPIGLSREGDEAHLHYSRHEEELRCINCHLQVGHYSKKAKGALAFGKPSSGEEEIFTEPARVEGFQSFTERIPGTSVSFEMIAVPGGEFQMGSPGSEDYRRPDEGPVRKVRISPFWMGKAEVSWNEYQAFYHATASEGRTDTRAEIKKDKDVDAITGATPPYGSPDQGWGMGDRPAITMTHHAAVTYCRWLSRVTGRTYRLPTEAEWEYACRGGEPDAYFFGGDPSDYTDESFWNSIFGTDEEKIARYVIYKGNAGGKTHPLSEVEPNPFGLLNMSGNVREFCLDWYAEDAYAQNPDSEVRVDPAGPKEGKEHVVRGGSFKSDAKDVRSAARDRTRHDAWMMTDPQMPKSLWWYSDCNDVGFRVVCEYKDK